MSINIHFCFWKRHVTLWIWGWTSHEICQTYTLLVNAYSSHSIHNAKEVGPQSTKGSFPRMQRGSVPGMQGDGFASEPGGIMEVAVWLCIPLLLGLWCSLGLVPSYVVLVLGNEGGGPHHMRGCHTRDLWIGIRKLVVLTLNIHQMFNWD